MATGNLLVGQSGGCTAVMNASLAGVLEEAADQSAVGRVFGMVHGALGLVEDQLVEINPDDAALRARLAKAPAAALGSCRHRIEGDEVEQALAVIRRHDIRYLHYIGGNDSANTSLALAEAAAHAGYELQVVGLPKTVDNDLPGMDHSPGFASAARFLAAAVIDAGLDTLAMRRTDPVKVIEVGGRYAGWLAAGASLGRRHEHDPPHLVYLPECPVTPEGMLTDIERVLRRTGWALVVISEGIVTPDGDLFTAERAGVAIDRFGHPTLGGAGRILSTLVSERLGVRAKYDRPGSLQRLLRGYVAPVDRREARATGRAAVRLAVNGQTGVMTALQATRTPGYRSWVSHTPLAAVAGQERHIPAEWLPPPDGFPGEAIRAYAMPLVGPLAHDDPGLLPAYTGPLKPDTD